MSTPKSYDLNQLDLEQETQRLRMQALLAWSKESQIHLRFGLQDGMSVIDLGCGPGFITEQLLALLPHSQVIALDNEPALIERARQLLQGKYDDRLRFVQASVMETGLPDNSVDFAVARFLFQHLPDPVGAAREVLRILKPGGRLVMVDIDEGAFPLLFDPPLPGIEAKQAQVAQAQQARGGNRNIARQFWRILQAAGFQPVDIEAIVAHSDMLGIDSFLQTLRLHPANLSVPVTPLETTSEPIIIAIMFAACGQKG